MKKVSLSLLAIVFAATSVMAGGVKPVKNAKAKHAVCTTCTKDKCTKKAGCPSPKDCGCE